MYWILAIGYRRFTEDRISGCKSAFSAFDGRKNPSMDVIGLMLVFLCLAGWIDPPAAAAAGGGEVKYRQRQRDAAP